MRLFPDYRTAVHLNPYEARYWLDLAGAYQVAGRIGEQAESVQHAVEADPTTPHVAWEAANFFLVQGDREKALRYFRVVLANDPGSSRFGPSDFAGAPVETPPRFWTKRLPPRAGSLLVVSRFARDQAAGRCRGKRLEPSDRVASSHFPPKLALPLLSASHSPSRKSTAAKTAWQQLSNVDPSLQAISPFAEKT